MTRALVLVLLAGCSDYAFTKPPPANSAGGGETGFTGTDSAPGDTAPPAPGDTGGPPPEGDTATPDQCYDPAFGFDKNAAVRIVTLDDTTPVQVSFVISSSAYQDEITLDSPASADLWSAWSAATGSAAALGPYPTGTELVFGLDVTNTGNHWESGPPDRNSDGVAHVAVTYTGHCSWVIGFEDLEGGGDLDYNDAVFQVQGNLAQEI